MRKSIKPEELSSNLIGKRVLYRYANKSTTGTVLAWICDNNYLFVELDDCKTLERHYTSWEVLS